MLGTVMALSYRYRLKATIPVMVAANAVFLSAFIYFKPSSLTVLYPLLIIFVVYLSFAVGGGLYGNRFRRDYQNCY